MCKNIKRITGDHRDNWNVISKDNDCRRAPCLDKSRIVRHVDSGNIIRQRSQAYLFCLWENKNRPSHVVHVWPKDKSINYGNYKR